MAIFQSVGQALHVSFLMETLPARQKCFAQVILENAQREMGIFDEGTPSTIDFSGLNDLEVRGQCAMVRDAVNTNLDKNAISVIHAMYALQKRKADGVRAVRDLCADVLTTKHDMATLAMAWSFFGTVEQRKDFSVRKIADGFGLHKSTVHDDVKKIRAIVSEIEAEAFSILDDIFVKSGVCEPCF